MANVVVPGDGAHWVQDAEPDIGGYRSYAVEDPGGGRESLLPGSVIAWARGLCEREAENDGGFGSQWPQSDENADDLPTRQRRPVACTIRVVLGLIFVLSYAATYWFPLQATGDRGNNIHQDDRSRRSLKQPVVLSSNPIPTAPDTNQIRSVDEAQFDSAGAVRTGISNLTPSTGTLVGSGPGEKKHSQESAAVEDTDSPRGSLSTDDRSISPAPAEGPAEIEESAAIEDIESPRSNLSTGGRAISPALAGGPAEIEAEETCEDPQPGTDCWGNITWAKTRGIWQNPAWYPGLGHHSPRSAFQEHLQNTSSPGSCKKPCPELEQRSMIAVNEPFPEACYFDYNGGPETQCFCKLANNRGCMDQPCTCPQGCGPEVTWQHKNSITFRNRARAYGCPIPTALLTIPKSYFSQIYFLKTWCPMGMATLITEMFLEGFNSYTENVGPAPVTQCIHAASHVSTQWLHLHTFCGHGHVDGMPNSPHVSWCSIMELPEDAPMLAGKAMAWALALYGPLASEQPTNCATLGCNAYGPARHCSCNYKCHQYGDCCPDYEEHCHR